MGAGKDLNSHVNPSPHFIDLETEVQKPRDLLPEVIEIRFSG